MEHNKLIPLINPQDVDNLIIQIDRYIFLGYDPTILLEFITFPATTEFLQIIYSTFYFFPLILCIALYRKESKVDYHITVSTIMLGFYLSFIGYYITPAIGPRFTLEHMQSFPLTGLFTFDFLRYILDAIAGVTRDCCPSGHTLVSVLSLVLVRTYYKKFFYLALTWTLFMILATVYLRYHYVTDVILGLILAFLVFRYGTAMARSYVIKREREI